MLSEIEHIDDEAEHAGIKFVKIDDKQMAKEVGVFALPAIVFYKLGSKEPVIYAGDIYEEQDILTWLETQKDPGGDVIEDLEGERLTKMIEEHSSIAVFFCEYHLTMRNRTPHFSSHRLTGNGISLLLSSTSLYKSTEKPRISTL